MTTLPGRSAGLLVPLFSLRSEAGFGTGELPDLAALGPWLSQARLSVLMLLPLNEVSLGQDSPYTALSAFAIDPIHVRLQDVEDFAALGGEAALGEGDRRLLARARAARTVDYAAVRHLKGHWLWKSFQHFHASGAAAGERGRDFVRFREEESGWLPDYTLFRAIKTRIPERSWRSWPADLRERDPAALGRVRADLATELSFRAYIQWQAYRQLAAARRGLAAHGVKLAGDLPFLVGEDSADVWARQLEFRFDATVGVPPDAFSADGQDWGLPVYRWPEIAAGGYAWLRQRGASAAKLYDLVRVDHVVGFYRTYVRPRDKALKHFFSPAEEKAQRRQGEAVMEAFRSGGVALVAEDLGTIPPFVRTSLTSLGIPGYKVFRWEKEEKRAAYRDPADFSALSLATTGTHDNEPLAVWWQELPETERAQLREVPGLEALPPARTFTPEVHQAFLEVIYGAGSDLLVLPIQDVYGGGERINLPGTVGPENWSYRMPWTIAQLSTDPAAQAFTARLAALAEAHGRVPGAPRSPRKKAPAKVAKSSTAAKRSQPAPAGKTSRRSGRSS